MNLTATTESLELVTTTTSVIDYVVDYTIIDKSGASTVTTPDSDQGQISTATTTTIVAAPAASIFRIITGLTIRNAGAGSNVITIQKDISAVLRIQWSGSLGVGESVSYTKDAGWQRLNANGFPATSNPVVTGYNGYSSTSYKTGTAADAAAYYYSFSKDSGVPGAWSPGTPGVNGRVTNGTTVADIGCFPFTNAATGGIFLTGVDAIASSPQVYQIVDTVWVNTGLVVTTTTAQAIVTPAFPARDMEGTINGKGYQIGLLFTAAATNAAAINNSTVSYTNAQGTPGRTATLANAAGRNIPATPVIGTLVWFQLQNGDDGVQSIQSITLGTSLVTGSISLLVARPIQTTGAVVSNTAVSAPGISNPGIRLYNGSCLHLTYLAVSTTAITAQVTLSLMER